MLSSFSTTLAQSAAQAQTVLGETFTLENDSTEYVGIMDEREALLPATVNGYQSIKELVVTATLTQFASAPSASTRPKLTARNLTWTVTNVKIAPFHYHFTCVPAS